MAGTRSAGNKAVDVSGPVAGLEKCNPLGWLLLAFFFCSFPVGGARLTVSVSLIIVKR